MKKRIIAILILTLGYSICGSYAQSVNYNLEIRFLNEKPVVHSKVLQKIQKSYSDSSEVYNQINHFKNYLHDLGYISANVDSIDVKEDTLIAFVYTGQLFTWLNIEADENIQMRLDELGYHLPVNETIQLNNWVDMQYALLNYYTSIGYPFARVYLNNIEIQDSTINGHITVDLYNEYYLDEIFVKGNAKISSQYLQHRLGLKEKDAYNEKIVKQIDRKINEISFLKTIRPTDVEFSDNDFDLYLYLDKQRANQFDGIVGLTQEENSGKYILTGNLNLSLTNSFHHGESLYLRWHKLQSEVQKLNVGTGIPYIFRTKFGLNFDFELYKKDSTYLTLQAQAGFKYQFNTTSYIKIYGDIHSSSTVADQISSEYTDMLSYLFGIEYQYEKFDYQRNPKKGFALKWNLASGNKTINSIPEGLDTLGYTIDMDVLTIQSGVNLDWYINPIGNWVLHTSGKMAWQQGYFDEGAVPLYFYNELYRFGGTNSLRGFDEESLIAKSYVITTLEVRYHFELNSAIYFFGDIAYYNSIIQTAYSEDYPYAIGLGLDFDTRGGTFMLNYAIGSQNNAPLQLKNAKIHFGYVSRF